MSKITLHACSMPVFPSTFHFVSQADWICENGFRCSLAVTFQGNSGKIMSDCFRFFLSNLTFRPCRLPSVLVNVDSSSLHDFKSSDTCEISALFQCRRDRVDADHIYLHDFVFIVNRTCSYVWFVKLKVEKKKKKKEEQKWELNQSLNSMKLRFWAHL